MRVLEPFFNGYDSNYSELRTRCRDILQQEDSLSEIVQLVGRDSLSEDQKVRSIDLSFAVTLFTVKVLLLLHFEGTFCRCNLKMDFAVST